MTVPLQRTAVMGPEQQTLVVRGGRRALDDAVQGAAHAGWDTWAVAQDGAGGWRLHLARRDAPERA